MPEISFGLERVRCHGNQLLTVTMNTNKSPTANYVAPAVPYTLTINSSAAAFLTVSLADTNGNSNCNTPCTRIYNSGNSVTVTAPLISGDASYTLWSGRFSVSGAACTVAMSGNKTISVNYVSGDTYQLSRDYSNVQGQRGWSYLDSAGTQMTFGVQYPGIWNGSETNLLLTPSGAHPGATRGALLRWTSPVSGNLLITGNAHDGATGGGDGVDIAIKKGTTTLYSATISEGDVSGVNFTVPVVVTTGDTIDFVTSSRSNALFDTTVFDPVIAVAVQTPTTIRVGGTIKAGAGAVLKVGGQ